MRLKAEALSQEGFAEGYGANESMGEKITVNGKEGQEVHKYIQKPQKKQSLSQ